jgi:carbamoylphosphate synthase small subunit
MDALLALEDGRTFACRSFTGPGEASGEVVFNTSMTGYQEILTDPSYSGQMVIMTYPLIGNYGINAEDFESSRIQVAAFLIKEYQPYPSNFRSTATLADYLKRQGDYFHRRADSGFSGEKSQFDSENDGFKSGQSSNHPETLLLGKRRTAIF